MTALHGDDSRYIRDILDFFYGVSPEVVTDESAGLAAGLIYESVETSLVWDLVSDPPGFVPDSSWVFSDAVRSFWHQYGRDKIREAVRLAVAEKFQADFDGIHDKI